MDRVELVGAVARAIVELPGADVSWRPDWDEAADVAIRVVLAEAQRAVEALRRSDATEPTAVGIQAVRNAALDEALGVLAGLVPSPPV